MTIRITDQEIKADNYYYIAPVYKCGALCDHLACANEAEVNVFYIKRIEEVKRLYYHTSNGGKFFYDEKGLGSFCYEHVGQHVHRTALKH